MNNQPIERQWINKDGVLDVHSVFLTVQGEGPFVGQRAVFVRLAGCNLRCPGCDTDYTSTRVKYPPFDLLLEVARVSNNTKMLVVITGGEPFRQNLLPFCKSLLSSGYQVQIETNGTLYQDLPAGVVVVCSPKTPHIHSKLAGLDQLMGVKYVVKAGDIDTDGLPLHALDHHAGTGPVAKPPQNPMAHIYVQPMDEKDDIKNAANLEAAIDSVMNHGYTLCIQTHKSIGVE